MAVKHICDRCGAEINPRSGGRYCRLTHEPFYSGYDVPPELCVSCAYKISVFLRGGELKDGDNDG